MATPASVIEFLKLNNISMDYLIQLVKSKMPFSVDALKSQGGPRTATRLQRSSMATPASVIEFLKLNNMSMGYLIRLVKSKMPRQSKTRSKKENDLEIKNRLLSFGVDPENINFFMNAIRFNELLPQSLKEFLKEQNMTLDEYAEGLIFKYKLTSTNKHIIIQILKRRAFTEKTIRIIMEAINQQLGGVSMLEAFSQSVGESGQIFSQGLGKAGQSIRESGQEIASNVAARIPESIDPIQLYENNIQNSLMASIAATVGTTVKSIPDYIKSISETAAATLGNVRFPSDINPEDVAVAIEAASMRAAESMQSLGLPGGYTIPILTAIIGLHILDFSLGGPLSNLFNPQQVKQIQHEVRTGAFSGSTTEFVRGQEIPVSSEEINTPQGNPLLRPEFKQTGIDYFEKQFGRTPISVENSEWAEFNFVPQVDKTNGIEINNMRNLDIRFAEPMFLPEYVRPPPAPDIQAYIMSQSPMYDRIQLYEPFTNKFDDSVNITDSLTSPYVEPAFERNWQDNLLYN